MEKVWASNEEAEPMGGWAEGGSSFFRLSSFNSYMRKLSKKNNEWDCFTVGGVGELD